MVDGKVVKLHIWDTAGQERFAQVTQHYYRGADGAILVYDTTDPESFEALSNWLASIEGANSSDRYIAKLIVGNKRDLEHLRRVSADSGREFAKQIKARFVETSAKNATNVDIAFLTLARDLVERARKDKKPSKYSGLSLSNSNEQGSSKKCCG